MPRTLTCPRGHLWQSSGDVPSACPTCGAVVSAPDESLKSTSKLGDDLPPPPPPPAMPPPKPEVPGYELLEELGRGGMGVVYKARQVSLDRIVALKMLLAGPLAGPDDLARFRSEARVVARVQHPHIVHVYDIGEHRGLTYIALEFVPGGNLADSLEAGPLAAADAARLMATLARAVQVAHDQGIVHRDLKPANILLRRKPEIRSSRSERPASDFGLRISDFDPKVTDFGLAKRLDQATGPTQSGTVMGSPCYMAPEQAEGRSKDVGPATDVWALGAILYELLTGRPPFLADSSFHVLHQVVHRDPDPPSRLRAGLPPALDAVCLRCLQKDPARRFPSAAALADDLDRYLAAPSDRERRPRVDRRRAGLALGAVVLLAAGGWVAVQKWPGPNPHTAEPTWTVMSLGRPGESFDRIAFASRSVGFVASRQGLYKTADAGQTWSPLPLTPAGPVYALVFTNERTGWLADRELRHSTDGGATWATVPLPEEEGMASVTALTMRPDGEALAGGVTAGGELRLFYRRITAAPWERIDPQRCGYWGEGQQFRNWSVRCLTFRGPAEAVAALANGPGDRGATLHTRDGGATWETVLTADEGFTKVQCPDAPPAWLAGSRGGLWSSADGGRSWTAHKHPGEAAAPLTALALSPRGRLGLAAGADGEVFLTTDGATWRTVAVAGLNAGARSTDAVVVDDRCAFLLTGDGRIARFTDTHSPTGK